MRTILKPSWFSAVAACVTLASAMRVEAQATSERVMIVRSALDSGIVSGARVDLSESIASRLDPGADPVAIYYSESDGAVRFTWKFGSAALARITLLPGFIDTVVVFPGTVDSLVVWLVPQPVELPAIRSVAVRVDSRDAPFQIVRMTDAQRRAAPTALAISDPLRSAAVHPAVNLENVFSARPIVRGSDASQVSFHVNGFSIYNPFHSGGFVSTLPSVVGADLDLRLSMVPPWYPGSLAGAIDLQTNHPSSLRFAWEGNVMHSEFGFAAPTPNGGGVNVSVRRSWLERLWANAVNVESLGYEDLFVQTAQPVGGRSTVEIVGLRSSDAVLDSRLVALIPGTSGTIEDITYDRQTRLLGLRVNSLVGQLGIIGEFWGTDAFANASKVPIAIQLSSTSNDLSDIGGMVRINGDLGRGNWMLGFRYSALSLASDFLLSTELLGFTPGEPIAQRRLSFSNRQDLSRAFAGLDVHLGSRTRIGLSGALTHGGKTVGTGHVRLDRTLTKRVSAFLAVERSAQWTHFLFDPRQEPWSDFFVTDLWLLSGSSADTTISLARSTQTSAGMVVSGDIQLSATAYHRKISDAPSLLASQGETPVLVALDGDVLGLEISLEMDLGARTTLRGGYTWSRSRRTAGDEFFPADFDVPHRLKAVLTRTPAKGWSFSLFGTVSSGVAYTPPIGTFDLSPLRRLGASGEALQIVYGPRNSARTSITHRLDARIGYGSRDGRGVDWELFLSVLNLTNGQGVRPVQRPNRSSYGGRPAIFTARYSLPPVPLVGLRLVF